MLGLGLSSYLPSALRPAVHSAAAYALHAARQARAQFSAQRRRRIARAYNGKRVAILGFVDTRTGLGRGARLMHAQRRATGLEAAMFDVTPLLRGDMPAERHAVQAALRSFAPTDVIVHVNPPEYLHAVAQIPMAVFSKASVVAYWAWELEELPATWIASAVFCDEIWTPSDFVRSAVRRTLPHYRRPVRVVGHPVDIDPAPAVTPANRAAARAALFIPSGAFAVGASFSMGSNFARKNPLGAIGAFRAAFPDETHAVLLIRCHDTQAFPPGYAALSNAAMDDSRIRIIDTETPIFEFYHALDAFISLHRSEGFGLNLAEAMQAGIDVVATTWSISDDIRQRAVFHGISYTLVPVEDPQGFYVSIAGARWAEPDVADAAEKLRAIHVRTMGRARD